MKNKTKKREREKYGFFCKEYFTPKKNLCKKCRFAFNAFSKIVNYRQTDLLTDKVIHRVAPLLKR